MKHLFDSKKWFGRFFLPLLLSVVCGFPLLCQGQSGALGSTSEILWDKWGIPHIYADTNEDLFYAYGYAQAHNHANRLLKLYSVTRCKAAEYWGDEYADYDYWAKIMGIEEKAQSCYEAQSDEMKSYIAAFAEGINDFAFQNLDSISPELQQILPVTPRDVAGHTVYVLYYFMVNPYTVNYERYYYELSSGKVMEKPRNGSNGWAIAPSHTENGHSILLANPHLPWPETSKYADFNTFFEAHWSAPDVNAYGASILGMPFLQIAFNENLGWTHTVNEADYLDFYEIEMSGSGYLWDGGIEPLDTGQESFNILQEDGSLQEQTVSITKTVHGPLIATNGYKGLALKTVDFGNLQMFEQYWDMCRASNFTEYETAIQKMQLPYFNTLYTDREGHVFFFHGAMIPRRPQGGYDWDDYIPGTTSDTLWTEYHAYDEIPQLLDPDTGWLQNANDPPWYCTYPVALNSTDYPSYMKGNNLLFRPQRSIELMMNDDGISFDEAVEYKHSTRMLFADRVLDGLIEAAKNSGLENAMQAASILEAWDRTADNDSVGGVIFELWAFEMIYAYGQSMFEIAWSEDDPIHTPHGLADPETAVVFLDNIAAEILQLAGTLAVPWGTIHRFHIDDTDLPGNGASGSLGVFRTMHFDTDNLTHQTPYHGDTYTAVIEFGDMVRAKAVLTYGNASEPGSPHRTDQLILASNKQMRDVLLNREDVEANLEKRTLFNGSSVPDWELY